MCLVNYPPSKLENDGSHEAQLNIDYILLLGVIFLSLGTADMHGTTVAHGGEHMVCTTGAHLASATVFADGAHKWCAQHMEWESQCAPAAGHLASVTMINERACKRHI